MATAGTQKLSREDFKRQKALEEQRKAGTIPAEIDPETGKDINPHIPQYISQAPWYLDISYPTLKHQKEAERPTDALDVWYDRGRKGHAATKYRKGACTNCGAITHKSKDCMERPRGKGAKWTGEDIQADEIIQDVKLVNWDSKRDRWNGYDAREQAERIREWELVDEERRKIRERNAAEGLKGDGGDKEKNAVDKGKGKEVVLGEEDSDDEADSDDEDKYADGQDMPGQKLDLKTRTTVRNLRIREDTAKYLLNLDVNSSHYDPKTRSMRENPLSHKDINELTYAGDNFQRYTGDATKMAQLQMFAWDASKNKSASDVHLQANPSQAELLHKQYREKKEALTTVTKDSILQKYGGEEYLKVPAKELLLSQTEHYVEYSQTGRVIKGQERAVVRGRYEEDVYPFNHTSVWGSYFSKGKWGYACCHSFLQNAYCTGEEGKEAAAVSNDVTIKPFTTKSKPTTLTKGAGDPSRKFLGEGGMTLDDKKLEEAREKERKRKRESGDIGKGKGKYMSTKDNGEVTEEQLEAYRMEKQRGDDPMANFTDEV